MPRDGTACPPRAKVKPTKNRRRASTPRALRSLVYALSGEGVYPMHSQLLGYFLDALTALVHEAEEAVTSSTDAYSLAAVSLAVTGVSEAQVYQAVPQMHPRTVRRVLAGRKDTVHMCMSSSLEGELVHKDTSSEAVLAGIRDLAEKARVAPGVAESAVTRYGNSPERVRRVLEDLVTLRESHCKVWNPSGLFTRLMRSGKDVVLPERVLQARKQAQEVKAEKEARPTPQPGMMVKLYGEVCRILEVTRQFALVQTSIDDIRVPVDQLRFMPTP